LSVRSASFTSTFITMQLTTQQEELRNDSLAFIKSSKKKGNNFGGLFEQLNTDEAHFIYEVLQNADDVKASWVIFELKPDKLVFKHNGTVKFTLSNENPKGHINAITSFGNSTKGDTPEIGKFGIGFKTVYKYTRTPHIYEDEFKFKIDDYFVPDWLETDFPQREPGETVFVFPFDHPDFQPKQCYETILRKLKELQVPTLYLSHLISIDWFAGTESGRYSYAVSKTGETKLPEPTKAIHWRKLSYSKRINSTTDTQHLLQFYQSISVAKLTGGQLFDFRINVTYLLDENYHLQVPDRPFDAFCFFPTHYPTGLKFMVHAPFLLSANREGLEVNEMNRARLAELATLAANSLYTLRQEKGLDGKPLLTDALFKIISTKPDKTPVDSPNRLSFNAFYEKTVSTIKAGRFLPTSQEGFVSVSEAKWADSQELADIFDRYKLQLIEPYTKSQWVFRAYNRRQTDIKEFIDTIGVEILEPTDILWKLTASFIEYQSEEWLLKFYRYLNRVKGYNSKYKNYPFFLNELGKAMPLLNDNVFFIFLPYEKGYSRPEKTIKSSLLTEDSLKDLKDLGLKVRDKWDEINEAIADLARVVQENDIELMTIYWSEFLQYNKLFKRQELYNALSDKACLPTLQDGKLIFKIPSQLYLANEKLLNYFNGRFSELLVNENFFKKDTNLKPYWDSNEVVAFLLQIGVSQYPRVLDVVYKNYDHSTNQWLSIDDQLIKFNLTRHYLTHSNHHTRIITDKVLTGFDNFDSWLTVENSAYILDIITKNSNSINGIYQYFYRTYQYTSFESTLQAQLQNIDWLYDKQGNRKVAADLSIDNLSQSYTLNESTENFLFDLGVEESENDLPPEVKKVVDDMNRLKASFGGELPDDLIEVYKAHSRKKANDSYKPSETSLSSPVPLPFPQLNPVNKTPLTVPPYSIRPTLQAENVLVESNLTDSLEQEFDALKKQYEIDQEKVAARQPLLDTIKTAGRYSFTRQKALLAMEALTSKDNFPLKRSIDITFTKVELASHVLTLRQPSRSIPFSLEDNGDMTIRLVMRDGPDQKIKAEVVTVKDFSLQARIAKTVQINELDLSAILSARITINDPAFLLDSLIDQFNQLPFEDTDDLREALPQAIRFIFGPPGTGKTTWLATWLSEQMRSNQSKRILVLTPTNKAADVLCGRIKEMPGAQSTYTSWLYRFGTTADSHLEDCLVDKRFPIDQQTQYVVTTTMARFTYDSFYLESKNEALYLRDMPWDHVVFDEASMISLASIFLVIHKTKVTAQFLVAGDPFQIQPVTRLEELKGQNIYSAVNLETFKEDFETYPHQFPIERLTTQYRSLPAIGELFSQFCYDGKLTHHRSHDDQRLLKIGDELVAPITIIRFPITATETLYRLQRLNKSAYQIYSALFAYELAQNLAVVASQQPGLDTPYKIGVICPYKAQATIVEKLVSASVKKSTNVEILVGTVHGFQGDQCQTIIALLNPPPSAGTNASINDRNILNVAISRAQDQQFLIVPDQNIGSNTQLPGIQQIEAIATQQRSACKVYTASSWEKAILGDASFIKNNAFVTTHQVVNIYDRSSMPYRYEIRCEEDTIDVLLNTL
jgi:hypothetical protein